MNGTCRPFRRTVETAAFIGNGLIDCLPEIRLRERYWVWVRRNTIAERLERFADTERRREISSYNTRYDGGREYTRRSGSSA